MGGDPPVSPPPSKASQTDRLLDRVRAVLRQIAANSLADLRAAPLRSEVDALLSPLPPVPPLDLPPSPALDALVDRFRLGPAERDAVGLGLAVHLDPRLGRAIGLLLDPHARPAFTSEALGHLVGRSLGAETATRRWGILSEGGGLDPTVAAWLLGQTVRDPRLHGRFNLIPVREPLRPELAEATAERVAAHLARGDLVRVVLRGPPGAGRRSLFSAIARGVGLAAADVDTTGVDDLRVWEAVVWRQAWLDGVGLHWSGPFAGEDGRSGLGPFPLQALSPLSEVPRDPRYVDLIVHVGALDSPRRRRAWSLLVADFDRWSPEEMASLVAQPNVRPGQIAQLGRLAPSSPVDAREHLREAIAAPLRELADLLPTPYTWSDLVLPAPARASLGELRDEILNLPQLAENPRLIRFLPQGSGVVALLSGPPGTGKTMSAQVLAGELGRPLFRIDLSRTVSKYIGETSQNLARVLDAARNSDVIVLFDEADALFGRRTDVQDAHDRYANTETNFLLQAIENWPGVALLATNKRGAIDPAFLRRLRAVIEFPRPGVGERAELWARLLATFDTGFPESTATCLAEALDLTGAQIKAATLSATLASRVAGGRLTLAALVRGIERELEKEGRGLSTRDRRRLEEGR